MSNTVVVIHQMGMLFFGNIFFFMCIVVIVGNKCLFSGGGGIGLMIYSKSRYIGSEKLWNYSAKAKSVMTFLQKSLMNHLSLTVHTPQIIWLINWNILKQEKNILVSLRPYHWQVQASHWPS